MKQIVTMGGGGGHSQVLKSLKSIKNIQITGICPSTDSGGSTGILQQVYDGKGYTGDLTKCILALCNNDTLTKALAYRYQDGPLHSHSVKNLLFHALEKVSTEKEALEVMWSICNTQPHRVIPVTAERAELCASLNAGNTVSGETNIDTIAKNPLWNPGVHAISKIYLKPNVSASKLATGSIKKADFIVISPGDLYSSLIPTLLPKGVKNAFKKSKAKIIVILNIMTKQGETDNYTASDFIERIEKHLGKQADYVLYNNAPIPNNILLKYSLEKKVKLGNFNSPKDQRLIAVPLAMINESDQILSNPKVIKKTIEKIIKQP